MNGKILYANSENFLVVNTGKLKLLNAFHDRGSDVEVMIRDFDRILTSNRTSYQIDSGNVIFTHHYKGSKLRVFLNDQISK